MFKEQTRQEVTSDNHLLTVSQLAEKLVTPKSWIYGRTRQRGPDAIPMVRVGKYCRFRLADVLAWLEKRQGSMSGGRA